MTDIYKNANNFINVLTTNMFYFWAVYTFDGQ